MGLRGGKYGAKTTFAFPNNWRQNFGAVDRKHLHGRRVEERRHLIGHTTDEEGFAAPWWAVEEDTLWGRQVHGGQEWGLREGKENHFSEEGKGLLQARQCMRRSSRVGMGAWGSGGGEGGGG